MIVCAVRFPVFGPEINVSGDTGLLADKDKMLLRLLCLTVLLTLGVCFVVTLETK